MKTILREHWAEIVIYGGLLLSGGLMLLGFISLGLIALVAWSDTLALLSTVGIMGGYLVFVCFGAVARLRS